MSLCLRCLVGRLRGQARSHKNRAMPQIKCGSGLAREGCTSVTDLHTQAGSLFYAEATSQE